ncbi:MAG: hypothetical protein WAK53_11555, partial [Chromatiaceae bacterium]
FRVVETIKEGETVFALMDEEQRKADLMHKPDSHGNYAFARTLDAAARYHDLQTRRWMAGRSCLTTRKATIRMGCPA